MKYFQVRLRLFTFCIFMLTLTPSLIQNADARHCWWWSFEAAHNPLPWAGCGVFDNPDCTWDYLGGEVAIPKEDQLVLHEHCNWHCAFMPPFGGTDAEKEIYGNNFMAVHRHFILDFDIFRTSLGWPRFQAFEAQNNDLIPGNNETTDSDDDFTWCGVDPDDPLPSEDNPDRAGGTACAFCDDWPTSLIGDDNLDDFATIGEVGWETEGSGWHGSFHNGVAAAGAGCAVIGPHATVTLDPAFWMAHKMLDELVRNWERVVAADIVILVDQSGSMDNDCSDADDNCATSADGSPCKLTNAKEAVRMFAQLIRDFPDVEEHMVGLVSFNGNATDVLDDNGLASLLPATGLVADEGDPATAFENALDTIEACGSTSIGAGLELALDVLDTGTNQHQAILILSDGKENTNPLINDVSVPVEVQVAAIGYGTDFGDTPEATLRNLCEAHGGIVIADSDLSDDGINLQKFFGNALATFFDESIESDPILDLPAGEVATLPMTTGVCATDSRLMFLLGREWGPVFDQCGLNLIVETPTGNLVDLNSPEIERGAGRSWGFGRIPLPYQGEHAGPWTAYGVRPQRVYTHGFTTDAIADTTEGIKLVRREIHRLFPEGCGNVLYFEDGSASGFSIYRDALQMELAAGGIQSLTTAVNDVDFANQLANSWDLVVFARQIDLTPKAFDPPLASLICQGQKALLTDFLDPAANPILQCAGVIGITPINYTLLVGDGRLVEGNLTLLNKGYNIYSYSLQINSSSPGPWRLQALNDLGTGSIMGNGSKCEQQQYFFTTLVRGFGRVEALPIQARTTLGQQMRATFRNAVTNRPVGDWDAVTATVSVDRPGVGPPETYSLYDDGTNGDEMAGNGYWERTIPVPVTTVGPHMLRANFTFEKDGCTVSREASYSVLVDEDPQTCTHTFCPKPKKTYPGQLVSSLFCMTTRCSERDSFMVTFSDSKGWLCHRDSLNTRTPVASAQFQTRETNGEPICIPNERSPYFLCVPDGAVPEDSTVIQYSVQSLAHPNEAATICSSVVRVTDLQSVDVSVRQSFDFSVHAMPNPANSQISFHYSLPTAGRVQLRVYDVSGRLVSTVLDAAGLPGQRAITWDARDAQGNRLASNVYFYRFTQGTREARGSIVIIR